MTTRNANFQQWQALLTNRTKRQRLGEFVVQGVRPISMAVAHGWQVRTLIQPIDQRLSGWARDVLHQHPDATRVHMAPDLLRELGAKDEQTPELLAVVATRPDELTRIPVRPDFLGLVFDRPTSPGNIGTIVRSADAFGASGVVVTGHAADVYDPKAVRASTGSLFALPTVRESAPRAVVDWLRATQAPNHPVRVIGTDETGELDIADCDLTGPVLLVIGNETSGMSAAWRDACDQVVRIPIGGSASSLNAAAAATVLLYETARQRRPTH
ncbi:TrmH family RNA methyltransferase [Goodfellowiella coeruleoviolacea]|uniref:TrmH family RNA methyltransferase n=1 Tax=Goodfellowiella coeruleoviolacea TaxID=334858 RepID=UPI0020A2CCB6|nr:TrmH family RNA methyltransferase [Goodfellowiella coeruleoviolacea]